MVKSKTSMPAKHWDSQPVSLKPQGGCLFLVSRTREPGVSRTWELIVPFSSRAVSGAWQLLSSGVGCCRQPVFVVPFCTWLAVLGDRPRWGFALGRWEGLTVVPGIQRIIRMLIGNWKGLT